MGKIYLYLARRDKSAVKILSILQGQTIPATRVGDIKDLNLAKSLETKIGTIVHENRIYWETWIESAESNTELKKRLVKRGYKDIPLTGQPMVIAKKEDVRAIIPNMKKFEVKTRVMIQKIIES